jgi:hypothetical protein
VPPLMHLGGAAMALYRIYFRTAPGLIAGRDDFLAADDTSALIIANMLADACADICEEFELWDGVRRVDEPRAPKPKPRRSTESAQDTVVEREIALRDSNWAVARSKRLLARLEKLGHIHH